MYCRNAAKQYNRFVKVSVVDVNAGQDQNHEMTADILEIDEIVLVAAIE